MATGMICNYSNKRAVSSWHQPVISTMHTNYGTY